MSNLIVIAYDDASTAGQVMDTLGQLQKEQAIELEDAVVVTRKDNGKLKLHQSFSTTGAGAAGGAMWGGLIGLLFFAPFLGMAVGAAAGAAGGSAADIGVDDAMMKDIAAKLQPGGALLFLLVSRSTPDKVIPKVQQFGGHVVQTSLSDEAEQALKDALEGTPAS